MISLTFVFAKAAVVAIVETLIALTNVIDVISLHYLLTTYTVISCISTVLT
jgi:hypothetical protein